VIPLGKNAAAHSVLAVMVFRKETGAGNAFSVFAII
jgi:hypothetical protein